MTLLGERIKKYTDEKGWTISELAKEAGTTNPCIYRYMNGTRAPTAVAIYKLARALEIPVEKLMDWVE